MQKWDTRSRPLQGQHLMSVLVHEEHRNARFLALSEHKQTVDALLTALLLISTPSLSLAEPPRGGTLKLITQNDLKVLDPFWTTAYISRNRARCGAAQR
jgi:hypothetical protein